MVATRKRPMCIAGRSRETAAFDAHSRTIPSFTAGLENTHSAITP